jgi:hypothetical protein
MLLPPYLEPGAEVHGGSGGKLKLAGRTSEAPPADILILPIKGSLAVSRELQSLRFDARDQRSFVVLDIADTTPAI